MPETQKVPRNPSCRWLLGPLLILVACSHEAKCENPFDLALTAPVEMTVALDQVAGTATVTRTRYVGDRSFARYQVLRHIVESPRVETLTAIYDVTQTTFVDASLAPNTAYVYRVSVINGEGFGSLSSPAETDGHLAGAVNLLGWPVDAQKGQVALRWSRCIGKIKDL